jgi:hypothetical protein
VLVAASRVYLGVLSVYGITAVLALARPGSDGTDGSTHCDDRHGPAHRDGPHDH